MADQDFTVRKLGLDDVLPLVRICNQAFLEHARFPVHGVQSVRYIADHPAWQWGVFRDGGLVAFLLTEPLPEKKHVAIRLVATDPGIKGSGLGSLLLRALETQAPKEGYRTLSVGTPFARGFYEKNGFRLTKTNLRMIRNITCQPVPCDQEPGARLLDFQAAAGILPRLGNNALRRAFLSAFLGNVRREQSLMLMLGGADGPRGVVIGRTPESYRDFAEVVFHHTFDRALAPLVRAFERTVSALGLHYVGFEVAEDQEREMELLGYTRSGQDFFWTMYILEKQLEG